MLNKENSTERFTIQPIQAGDCSQILPEFGRVQDVQKLFGVKRGILYRWIGERRIQSVLVRERGNKQGIRLIYLQSVREYLLSEMKSQMMKVEETVLTA